MFAHTARTTSTGEDAPVASDEALTRTLKVLALIALAVYCLYVAQAILIPFAFAAVVAMLVAPLVAKLSTALPRGVAIGAVAFAVFAVIAVALALIGQQLGDFTEQWPEIQRRALDLVERGQAWVAQQVGISESAVADRVSDQLGGSGGRAASALSSFAGTLTGFLTDFLLFFVYLILLLAAQPRLRTFVLAKAEGRGRREAAEALDDVRGVAGQYLRGRLLLIGLLFGVYLGGFTWAGLQFAVVVAAISALMSIVPYAGNVAAAGLVLAVAAISGDGFVNTASICLGTMAVAQVLESYVLTPLVVGKGVDLNPLSTILAVVGFGALWGLGGAVLAIPVVAIVRQVLGHLPRGREWAYLLSDSSAEDLGVSTAHD